MIDTTTFGAYFSWSIHIRSAVVMLVDPYFPISILFLFVNGSSLYFNVFYLVLQLLVGQKTYINLFSFSLCFNLYLFLRSKVVKMTVLLFQLPKFLVIRWLVLIRWIILICRLFISRWMILIHQRIISWFKINTQYINTICINENNLSLNISDLLRHLSTFSPFANDFMFFSQ